MSKDEIDFAHVLKTSSKMFFRKTSYQCFPSDNQLKLGQHRLLDITAAQNKKFPGSIFFSQNGQNGQKGILLVLLGCEQYNSKRSPWP